MNPQLVTIAIEEAPRVINLLKEIFVKKTGDPAPSNEQVIAAYRQAFNSSLAIDEAWLSTHPVEAPAASPPTDTQ